jgi:hypothetical protein
MKPITSIIALSAALLAAGCASAPTGPSVMALPGSGKSFEQFRLDDADCRQYAAQFIGGAEQAANNASVRNAAIGTAIGALAGAAIGGNHEGAGVGAGAGLIVGSASGAGTGEVSSYRMQRDYDHAYIQCMYAKGEKVPVSESAWRSQIQSAPAATTSAPPPPPPPGTPPPPPPR